MTSPSKLLTAAALATVFAFSLAPAWSADVDDLDHRDDGSDDHRDHHHDDGDHRADDDRDHHLGADDDRDLRSRDPVVSS